MKKSQQITLLIPIMALASCASVNPTAPVIATTPEIAHTPHVHKNTSNKIVNQKPTAKKTTSSSVTTAPREYTAPVTPIIPTHDIPGEPC